MSTDAPASLAVTEAIDGLNCTVHGANFKVHWVRGALAAMPGAILATALLAQGGLRTLALVGLAMLPLFVTTAWLAFKRTTDADVARLELTPRGLTINERLHLPITRFVSAEVDRSPPRAPKLLIRLRDPVGTHVIHASAHSAADVDWLVDQLNRTLRDAHDPLARAEIEEEAENLARRARSEDSV